uniref:Uncharacterized protein n=1 Tax=Meloidogyne enterolobii TaxID=390850 RepID=A0A6V7U860_MELEN|nr:unnamed protein product [Meloidogyne enterolobii]
MKIPEKGNINIIKALKSFEYFHDFELKSSLLDANFCENFKSSNVYKHWQKAPPRVHLSRRTLGGVAKKLLKLCLFFLFLQPVAAGEELILAVVGPLSVLLFVLVIVLLYCFDTETSTLMNNLPKARVDEEMKIENHEIEEQVLVEEDDTQSSEAVENEVCDDNLIEDDNFNNDEELNNYPLIRSFSDSNLYRKSPINAVRNVNFCSSFYETADHNEYPKVKDLPVGTFPILAVRAFNDKKKIKDNEGKEVIIEEEKYRGEVYTVTVATSTSPFTKHFSLLEPTDLTIWRSIARSITYCQLLCKEKKIQFPKEQFLFDFDPVSFI